MNKRVGCLCDRETTSLGQRRGFKVCVVEVLRIDHPGDQRVHHMISQLAHQFVHDLGIATRSKTMPNGDYGADDDAAHSVLCSAATR